MKCHALSVMVQETGLVYGLTRLSGMLINTKSLITTIIIIIIPG